MHNGAGPCTLAARAALFAADNGVVHIVADPDIISQTLPHLDLSRARLLSKLGSFWLQRSRCGFGGLRREGVGRTGAPGGSGVCTWRQLVMYYRLPVWGGHLGAAAVQLSLQPCALSLLFTA